MRPAPVIPFERTFDGLYGLQVLALSDELARGSVEVREELMQAMGLLHGGVLAAMAEALTSVATALAVAEDGNAAMGLSNYTSFMRPVTEGTVTATARRRHRGRTTWVWDVDFTDDQARLCATSRTTIAVRPTG